MPAPSENDLRFSCNCGTLRGKLDKSALKNGTHAECFCRDCRAAEVYFRQPDPAPGPVTVFQTTPDLITLTHGQDKLGLMRLGPNGLFRWYATCCDTPLFNTLKSPRFPFVGLLTARFEPPDPFGRIVARGHVPQAGGSVKHQGMGRMVATIFTRMIASRISGRWLTTPFFDAGGRPAADPRVLDKAERDALLP